MEMETLLKNLKAKFLIFKNDDESPKSSFEPTLEKFCEEILDSFNAVKNEGSKIRAQLDNINGRIQVKMAEIQNEDHNMEKFNDIGIGEFIESKRWCHQSIEGFQQELMRNDISTEGKKLLEAKTECVKTDANRMLKTINRELKDKIENSPFQDEERDSLMDSVTLVIRSIEAMNSRVFLSSQTSSDDESFYKDLGESVSEIEKNSDELARKVSNLRSEYRQSFHKMLHFNTHEDGFRALIQSRNCYLAIDTEKDVGQKLDDFMRDNRSRNGNLGLADIEDLITSVNDMWKFSYNEVKETNESMQVQLENLTDRLEESLRLQNEFETNYKTAQEVLNEMLGN